MAWGLLLPSHMLGQDRTVLYNISDPGVSKTVPTWGLDTAWLNVDNVRRGVIFMGQPQVDVIRFSFTGDWPLTNGDLGASALAEFNQRMAIVNSYADSHTALYLNNDSPSYDPSFIGGDGRIEPVAWAMLINVTRQRCVSAGRMVVSVSPYNEPDDGFPQGSVTRLGDVCWQLRNTYGANFSGINIYGASTLNPDNANAWYNTLNAWGYLEEGCTHQLAGSFSNYAAFYTNVAANGDLGVNDELHNVMEAMVGAEYGMDVGIWWGTAERARGELVKASDGQRLAYAEHRPNWTAASVYRAPDGKVQAFVGESERQALPTSYRFFSKNRDVFYDGHGPQRAYTVATTGGPGYATAAHRNAERVVNITWGDDVQPVINGRYILVNRNGNRVMQVAGGSTDDGANIQQYIYLNTLYQQWDVIPLARTNGGDYSYHSITAAHSGKAADVFNFSLDDGGDVRQWNNVNGVNQHWFLEYAGDGWFYIRSRWSGKYLESASSALFANVRQGSGTGGLNLHWRLIPVGAAVEFVPPAAPTNVAATANALSVQLSWAANSEPDFAGYTVLRATNSGGPYEIVARGLTNNAFTDKSANLPQTYFYVVQAVDQSLNRSVNSAQAGATPTGIAALIARYRFDGNANDSSVNANHPIVTSGTPGFAPGQLGSALDLDGSSQYTMLPANLLAGVSNFTIAVWVNWDGGGMWQRILDFGNGPAENMFLTPNSGGGTLRFAITTNNYWNEQFVEAAPLPVGQWRHVAVTRSGNTCRLYTNGVLAATAAVTMAPASFNPALNYLGNSQYEADPLFNGRLDELFIYNYALSDAEITRLMNNQPPPPTAPTRLAASLDGKTLVMSWPDDYLGCRLESNSVSPAVAEGWFSMPGSVLTHEVSIPINDSSSNVYFRLVYP